MTPHCQNLGLMTPKPDRIDAYEPDTTITCMYFINYVAPIVKLSQA